ncbi:hypothetical protein MJ1_0466 [Nanobdella aerobiophila]|uniref:Uncharacterized protein n=1 Tax=Nanobdella aerobiophila TaxID=2586965 RepID=A0A915WRU9_9ARCH|nr:hypothetical protein [Nanobdella aerobiophila]BBL45624.1 hypothetical protein MJ1_0466 [Nanobdella aerobiophila]
MARAIIFAPILFVALFFFSICPTTTNNSISQTNSTNSTVFYFNINLGGGFSPQVFNDVGFNIPINIVTSDKNLDWSVCLAGLPNGFQVSGSNCEDSNNLGAQNFYNFVLPVNGQITLTNPNLLSSNTVPINLYECYQYKTIYFFSGCFSNQQCNFEYNIDSKGSPIMIYSFYSIPSSSGHYIVVNFYIKNNNNLFSITNNDITGDCNLNSVNLLNYSFNYDLTLYINSNQYTYTGSESFSSSSNNYYIEIPVQAGNENILYGELIFNYFVFSEQEIGELNVVNN